MLISKLKLIIAFLIIMTVGVFLVKYKLKPEKVAPTQTNQTIQNQQNDSPKIVSTKPDPLENTIIPANQIIEITFNRTLENVGEFKVRIEPKIDFKVELSQDRKTGRVIPVKPYELGVSYTLTIGPDTKFDGVGAWGQTKDFHFRTITYKGV